MRCRAALHSVNSLPQRPLRRILVDPRFPPHTAIALALARHLRRLPSGTIKAVVATHHHEEHVGNLNWAAGKVSAPLYLSAPTAELLKSPWKLPFVRAAIIGQPDPLQPPYEIFPDRIAATHGELEVISTPGHCDSDHIVLYDRREEGPDRRRRIHGQLLRHAESRRRQLEMDRDAGTFAYPGS